MYRFVLTAALTLCIALGWLGLSAEHATAAPQTNLTQISKQLEQGAKGKKGGKHKHKKHHKHHKKAA